MDTEITIRTAELTDAERLLEIYSYYVENTAISFEYETPSSEEFRSRMKNILKKYPYIVAEQQGKPIGYAYAGTFIGRSAYDRSAETTIYVDHRIKRRGIGGRLYAALENILKEMNILNLNACIGYPKTEDIYLTKNSVEFHQHLGYQWVGLFHNSGYKFGRWYHMVWMEKIIGTHVSCPAQVIPFPQLRERFVAQLLKS